MPRCIVQSGCNKEDFFDQPNYGDSHLAKKRGVSGKCRLKVGERKRREREREREREEREKKRERKNNDNGEHPILHE